MLLAAQQDNKLRDELLGQWIATLFEKPADGKDGAPKEPSYPKLEFKLILYSERRRFGWLLQTSWWQNPLFLQLSV